MSNRRTWIVQVMASRSQAARASSTEKPVGLPSGPGEMQGRKIVVDQKADRSKTGEVGPLELDPRVPEIRDGDLRLRGGMGRRGPQARIPERRSGTARLLQNACICNIITFI